MSHTLYFAQLDDETFGPFALETIYNMRLTPDILVLTSDTNTWLPASEYPELVDSLDLSLYELEQSSQSSYDDTQIHINNSYISGQYPQAPSFTERSIFYVSRGGNPYGPYTLDALASVAISDDTDVSLDGMTTWWKARDISGLLNTLQAINMTPQQASHRQPVEEPPAHSSANSNEEISRILNQIQELHPGRNQLYRKVFSSKEAERDYLVEEYNQSFNDLLALVGKLASICEDCSLSRRAIAMVVGIVNDTANIINNHYMTAIDRLYSDTSNFTTSAISVGKTNFRLLPPLEDVEIERIDFLSVLGDKNLYITYDKDSEFKATDFTNSVIAKLYAANPARLIETIVIDTDFMTGLADTFKLLNRDLYKVVSRPEDIRATLTTLQDRASAILRNLLVNKGTTLQDYNSTHENKEANILLVLKGFPHGLSSDNLENLKRLSNVGPKVGIYIIILTDKDFVNYMDPRSSASFDVSEFNNNSNLYHFKQSGNSLTDILGTSDVDNVMEGNTRFETLTEGEIRSIVRDINGKCEMKDDVIVSFSEYLPTKEMWWSNASAKQIEIPFGLGNDMLVKSLKITQESGQNTAVVIGIPGSGKSVFLHSLICSAAVKYSPDELRMYLIDFSGVEFNSYAIGKLPHARVIAPEAEREFGLSILNELVEEGSRRMSLCRDHNVSNIVDLKRVAPEIKVPRLLVIIDEFQKLFEIENDFIAKEANSKIHIIIQEFRKFGINLILATQKLPSGSFLPRDLIANRIVFKSAPNDFDTLITTEDKKGIPRLRTGQCIYNSESGAAYGNEIVQGYYTSRNDIDALLAQLTEFEKDKAYTREQIKVFRSNEQPEFRKRRMLPHHVGYRGAGQAIPIYVGESVSVSDYDVSFELNHENGNNLLIVGGESAVAENICFHSLLSASVNHEQDNATLVVINGMRADNPLNQPIMDTLSAMPFTSLFPQKIEDIEATLTNIKDVLDERRTSGETDYTNIYIALFDAQSCRAFDPVSNGRIEKASNSSALMEYIIKNGPAVGVFTIMQIDNVASVSRIGSVMPAFNHRVVLQMPDRESQNVMNSDAASKLFIFNRPSSIYRAYLYDKLRNTSIKFKPYKS